MQGEAEGLPLGGSRLLSYTDEDRQVREASDAGGLARRLTQICLEKGFAVAGCAFDEEKIGATHIIITPEDEDPEPDGTEAAGAGSGGLEPGGAEPCDQSDP